MTVRIINEDCLIALPQLAADGFLAHACITDPPYHLTTSKAGGTGFMGKQWDGGDVAFRPETWRLVYDCLRPGGHLLAFGGTRGWHRMVCAIEDAGFEIRDQIASLSDGGLDGPALWVYASGFPKSHDVAKTLAKSGESAEVVARHVGIGSNLKPAWEPVCVARKPLEGTIAANVLAHGCGGLNIDACRIEMGCEYNPSATQRQSASGSAVPFGAAGLIGKEIPTYNAKGRFPANLIHDGSDAVEAAFAAFGERPTCSPDQIGQGRDGNHTNGIYGAKASKITTAYGDTGTASRFFYSAKVTSEERGASKHPTMKPIALMEYLVKMVTRPGDMILDPFGGSGSTAVAADRLQRNCTLIEMTPEYAEHARARVADDAGLFSTVTA